MHCRPRRRGTVKSMNGQTTIPTPSHPRLACPFMPLGGRACLINSAPFANLCVARRVTAPQADQLTTTAGPGVVIGFQSGSARPSSLTPSNRMGVTERATQPGVPLRRLEANHRHNKLTEQFIPSNVVGFQRRGAQVRLTGTTSGWANPSAPRLPRGGNETSWSWSPTRSNRAALALAARRAGGRHLPVPDRNKRPPAGPFPRAARCRSEFERQRTHHRIGRSRSLAHQVPPPNTRQGARCAVGGSRG